MRQGVSNYYAITVFGAVKPEYSCQANNLVSPSYVRTKVHLPSVWKHTQLLHPLTEFSLKSCFSQMGNQGPKGTILQIEFTKFRKVVVHGYHIIIFFYLMLLHSEVLRVLWQLYQSSNMHLIFPYG